ARAQRETYVGPWLPEPILTTPDVADDLDLAASVSMAMLVVLETLTPLERAVFVLKEVFGFPYAEIAEILGRSEVSVRQLGHRSREHLQARRPRFETGRDERRAVTEKFFAAALGGDLNELIQILAPEVVLRTDGGGRVRAALRPIEGAARVAAWLAGVAGRPYQGVAPADMTHEVAEVNGGPALLVRGGGRILTLLVVDFDAAGRAVAIHAVVNPDKLASVAAGSAYRIS
ncbi:MAG: sigma factor-like helix-turn-helix DNA-binding protein, partial [Streptosporangiaceae bacterium]